MLEDWIHWNVPTLIVILRHYIGTSWLCSVQQSALSSEGLETCPSAKGSTEHVNIVSTSLNSELKLFLI